MFLKTVLLAVIGFGLYFYYLSQLGPDAVTKRNLAIYQTMESALYNRLQHNDTLVGQIEAREVVEILSEHEGRTHSTCFIKTKSNLEGWVRCADLKKI